MADPVSNKPIIPSITGYPMLDTLLSAALVSGSTALATASVTWMNSHGFNNITEAQVSGTILGILITIATITWRAINSKKTQTVVADHVITAAATGEIPDAVKKEAIRAPSISEEKIEKALNNAQTIKENQ